VHCRIIKIVASVNDDFKKAIEGNTEAIASLKIKINKY
jgi:hypothetical protein